MRAPARRRARRLGDRARRRRRPSSTSQNKLYVRDRIALLFDEGCFVEDGRYANALAAGLPADGVVTGRGTVDGRPVIVIANDPTVKAGSWGARTVEKIVRATEMALREELPIFWFVDSAGARITDQVEMFPGRRGAGRIFHNQVALSGKVPQICCLFGPSAAGGAYIPAFTDIVIMVEGNASMYLGSPRMAEMVVGEKVSLEEMGGARMHCTVSGCRRPARPRRRRGDRAGQALLLLRARRTGATTRPSYAPEEPSAPADPRRRCPSARASRSTSTRSSTGSSTTTRFFEIKPLFAAELVIGFGRMDGETVGIVANNSAVKGGVLFTDSADKAARFIWLCDAFSIPLIYLADVPGFMIGSEVERGGIIRHGAKMVSAVSEATVPQFCVVVRKAYGAGLYAMGGPGSARTRPSRCPPRGSPSWGPRRRSTRSTPTRSPRSTDAAPSAGRVRGRTGVASTRRTSTSSGSPPTSCSTASSRPTTLRGELLLRLAYAARRDRAFSDRRRGVPPV